MIAADRKSGGKEGEQRDRAAEPGPMDRAGAFEAGISRLQLAFGRPREREINIIKRIALNQITELHA